MAKYYYYENDEKIGVTGKELQELAETGKITPDTLIENEEGKTSLAGKVRGLSFPETVAPSEMTLSDSAIIEVTHESSIIEPSGQGESLPEQESADEHIQDITGESDPTTDPQLDNPECNANTEPVPDEETSEAEEPALQSAAIEKNTPDEELLPLLQQLAKDFEVKLKYDASKQQLIDKLYADNQQFKEGIVKKFRDTMIRAVIEQIDDAAKQTAHFDNVEFTEENYRKLLGNYREIAEGFQNMLLEKFDVQVYHCEADTPFDPKRQRSLKTTPTEEQTKNKLVKRSLRPGYEIEDDTGNNFVLRPELVEVYVFQQ